MYELKDIAFSAVHGAGIAYFVLLATYLLLTKRSVWINHKPRKLLRKQAGITMLLWALTYLSGLIVFSTDFGPGYNVKFINILLDFAIVTPATMSMIHTTTYRGKLSFKHLIFNSVVGWLFFLEYMVSKNDMVFVAAMVFWAIILCCFLFVFYRNTKSYMEYIENEFSDIVYRDVSWINRFLWIMAIYGGVHLFSQFVNSIGLMHMAYVITAITWTYFVYKIDVLEYVEMDPKKAEQSVRKSMRTAAYGEENGRREERVNNLNNGNAERAAGNTDGKANDATLDANASAEKAAGEMPIPEVGGMRMEVYRILAEKVRKACEDDKLYLQSDLTIGGLATSVGTNRTYLWQYFRSRGTNFNNYINTLRVEYAKNLLLTRSDYSISRIGKESGFGSDASFRRIFGEMCGCSPSKFIQK